MLREKNKFQLLCRFRRSRRGHLLLQVWRLPAGIVLTPPIANGVEKLLKPSAIFSELDVFGVEETTLYPEDDLSSCCDISDLVPNHVFDAEQFYERV